jgi:hypothetical protein
MNRWAMLAAGALTLLAAAGCGGGTANTPTPSLSRQQQIDAWATELAHKVLQESSDTCSAMGFDKAPIDRAFDGFLTDPSLVPEIPASDRDTVDNAVLGTLIALCQASVTPSN